MEAQHEAGRLKIDARGILKIDRMGLADIGLKINSPWVEDAWEGDAQAEANMRRLAACWNACEGLPTEFLEKHGVTRSGIAKGVDDLTRQRDELLAALKKLLPLVEDYQDEGPHGEGWMSDKLAEAFYGASSLVDKIGGAA